MIRVRERVLRAVDLRPYAGSDEPIRREGGGSPHVDGSQRYATVEGRVAGDLPQAAQRHSAQLSNAGFTVIEVVTDPPGRAEIVASQKDLVVRIRLLEEGNPGALPAESGMTYAFVDVALRNSEGDVLKWTHIATE